MYKPFINKSKNVSTGTVLKFCTEVDKKKIKTKDRLFGLKRNINQELKTVKCLTHLF